MTLRQFFEWVQSEPSLVLYYYVFLFALTLLANYFAKSAQEPGLLRWVYAVIIYLVCIPGIFAVTLNVYFFLFEKRSIMDAELLLQFLPILMMIAILYLIKKQIQLDHIPGMEKLSSLIVIISVLLSLMWVVDRTHLYAISFVPFYYVILVLVIGILLIRNATRNLFR